MVALQELHFQIRSAVELGEMSRSRRFCQAILEVCPHNLETLLLLAEVELEGGAYRSAASGFSGVLAGDPESYLACAGLAIAEEALRDPVAALHWHSRALDLNLTNGEIRKERNRLFEQAYPGVPVPQGLSGFAVARSLLDIGRYAEAIEGLRQALAEEPGRAEVKVGLAEILWVCGKPREAGLLCQELLADIPSVKAKVLLACIAADAGDMPGGWALLRDVHAQDPSGRIGGHLVGQTALAEWASIPVDISVALPQPAEPEFFSGELPSWSHWMRRAMWKVLRVVFPTDDESLPDRLAPPPTPDPRSSSTGPIGRRLHEEDARDLEDLPGDPISRAERVLVSEEVQVVRIGTLLPNSAEAPPREGPGLTQAADADAKRTPAPSGERAAASETSRSAEPDPAHQPRPLPPDGSTPSASRGERRRQVHETTDPDTTEDLDEPAWVRLQNELRKEHESR